MTVNSAEEVNSIPANSVSPPTMFVHITSSPDPFPAIQFYMIKIKDWEEPGSNGVRCYCVIRREGDS